MKPTTTTRPLQKRSKKHRNSWKPASNTSATLKTSNCSESVNEPAQKRWCWCCNGVAGICAPPPSGDVTRTTPLFSLFSGLLRAFQRRFSYRARATPSPGGELVLHKQSDPFFDKTWVRIRRSDGKTRQDPGLVPEPC